MGERCDYQRLSSAEEEEEVHGPLPHSFSDSTGQRALRLGSRRPTPPPRQDIAPGMARRVSAGEAVQGSSGGHLAQLDGPRMGMARQLARSTGAPCMASPLCNVP
ncbi:hypothetical protein HGM15179_009062 [Zosterops borbonicus]|uniref:Uncharacterized protein n=1 Tax=Zosterops borbonicus TaxID=364589 RepID=A0A8K1GFW3_9PASS|nr:hypothetical protein HGM15179_009062 [Zosterops borbonicus]